jgi:hypothetical protein
LFYNYNISFSVKNWYAWTPTLEGNKEGTQWKQCLNVPDNSQIPEIKFVPPILRRRLSRLSRIMLYAANKCVPQKDSGIRKVFASRHGEIHRTVSILEEFYKQGVMSPAGFSLSVHNTGAGLYSIVTKDMSPSVSIAAGPETFFCSMIESAGWLRHHPSDPVLLVIADEPLPDVYHGFTRHESLFAAAFLLSSTGGKEHLKLKCDIDFGSDQPDETGDEPDVLQFLNWLSDRKKELAIRSRNAVWRWQKD